jgi:uncharacterized protein YjbJ (UPF0337 family)
MSDSLKNKVEGTAREAKGKIKETAGRATNNPELADRGTAEKVAGKMQRKVGEVEKVFGK